MQTDERSGSSDFSHRRSCSHDGCGLTASLAPSFQRRRVHLPGHSNLWVLLALLAVCALPLPLLPPLSSARAALLSGDKYTDDSWVYLQKFCFDQSGGHVTFTLREDPAWAANSTQHISFYVDQEEVWHDVYNDNRMSCKERVDRAVRTTPLSALNAANNYTHTYTVGGVIPRWWYIAVSNCYGGVGGAPGPVGLSYWRIHFTNRTGFWSYEYSKDVQGVLEMSIFFLILYWCLLFVLAWIKQHAKGKGMQYTVVKYVFVSVLLDFIALLFNLAHFARFGHDGIGVPELEHAYFFLDFMSNLVLLYAVMNICKGWAISTNYLPDKRLSYLVIALLFILYVALFIWQQEILDPASVLYVYETPPGWTIVAIRCLLVVWAIWCLVTTYRLEDEVRKKQFYLVWSCVALTWLGSLPVIVGIAHELPSWVRRRIVFGLVNSVQAALYLVLTYLFRPFRSNRYVDILKPGESRAFGNNNMQVFPSVGPVVQFAVI